MKDLMRTLLRHAVQPADGAFVPDSTEHMNAQHFQALLDAARERLRDAHSARDRAAHDLRECEDRLRRALGVIEESAGADNASDQAERAARAASQAWAARGCPECDEPDRDLLDRAAAAQSAAAEARMLADGARDAIPALERALESARASLGSAESEVLEAARGVLVARAESRFAVMARAAMDFDQASRDVQGLARALSGRIHPFGSNAAAGALLTRIREALPVPPAHDTKDLMLNGGTLDSDEWVALGRRLLEDANAKE